ncbi:hypothetical protein AVEN_196127-1 [Araneus ventricosus]|uniref:Uncharacterized protein n=1 Tax=Araneus ventricosus TaxID=182803 RepID=A0A4Y2E0S0_ARAVE|nr:hypothetical protein AVEN_196127-1 [Araneus ventricosus]
MFLGDIAPNPPLTPTTALRIGCTIGTLRPANEENRFYLATVTSVWFTIGDIAPGNENRFDWRLAVHMATFSRPDLAARVWFTRHISPSAAAT